METGIKSSKGITGCLLFYTGKPFLRVYDTSNNQRSFKDYEINVDDLWVTLNSDYTALVEYSDGTKQVEYNKGRLVKD